MIQIKTPDEFINDYYRRLQKTFEAIGFHVSKTGFFGFLVNLVAWSTYDAANYYNKLYMEMFPELALDIRSLLLFADRYNVPVRFAQPAQAIGNFTLYKHQVLDNVPPDVIRVRLVLLDRLNDESLLSYRNTSLDPYRLIINDTPFFSLARYEILHDFTTDMTLCYIYDQSGKLEIFPLTTDEWTIPIAGLYQFDLQYEEFIIPIYRRGSFYTHKLNIPPETIYDVSVFVEVNGTFQPFEVLYSEHSASSDAHVVFLNIEPDGISIKFGSGYRGAWVSGYKAVIVTKTTLGTQAQFEPLTIYPSFTLQYFYTTATTEYQYVTTSGSTIQLDAQFVDASDFPTSEELRYAILAAMRSRNTLVSEDDFRTYFSLIYDYCDVLFRKYYVSDNSIILLLPLITRMQTFAKTISHTYLLSDFGTATHICWPTYTINGQTCISPFLYTYNATLDQYEGWLLYPLTRPRIYNILEHTNESWGACDCEIIFDETVPKSTITLRAVTDISEWDYWIRFPQYFSSSLRPFTYEQDNILSIDYSDPATYSVFYGNDLSFDVVVYKCTQTDIGTCTISSATPTIVTGTGTFFTSTVHVGDWFWLNTDGQVARVRVASVDSDTQLTLETPYAGTLDVVDFGTIKHLEYPIVTLTYQFTQCYDFRNYVVIPKLHNGSDVYVVDVPFIRSDDFTGDDRIYILNQIRQMVTDVDVSRAQMITDTIRLGFCNTLGLNTTYTKATTLQQYNVPLTLPLKLRLTLIPDLDLVQRHNIDLREVYDKIQLDLFKRLQNNKTRFYNAEVIDYLKDEYPWFKDVRVELLDSAGNYFNRGIELIEKHTALEAIWDETGSKIDVLNFIPIFLYWDDIEIIQSSV